MRAHGGGLLRGKGGGRGSALFRACRRSGLGRSLYAVFHPFYRKSAVRAETAPVLNLGVTIRAYHSFTFSSCRLYGALFALKGLVLQV